MSSSCNPVATIAWSPLPCLKQHQRPNAWPLVLTATSLAFQCLRKLHNTLTWGSPTRVPPGCIMRHIFTFTIMYTIKVSRWFKQLSLLLPVIFPCGPRASPHQRLWPFAIKMLDAHAVTHAKHTELSVHCHRNLPHEPITVTYPETLRSFLQSRNYIYMPCTTGTEGSLPYEHKPSTRPIRLEIHTSWQLLLWN
jgi:hypothetical protein